MTHNPNFVSNDEADLDIREIDHISTHTGESISLPIESKKSDYVVVLVLFVINLLNYIDRFTIPGVLSYIKTYYHNLNDAEAGILQTAFIVTYMLFSPIFGYLGDRINRKWIIVVGISFWSLITLSSSFVTQDLFWLFVVMRSLVGIGEASYSTVAPTIIADLFVSDLRTKVMAFFYFAVPIGSGLGFILGSGLRTLFGNWQAALRVTPAIGIVCVVLLIIFVREPQRGKAEGGTHLAASPWLEDVRQLTKNRSFMFISLAFTAASFVLGSVSWFAVLYLKSAICAKENNENADTGNVEMVFGAMMMVAGFVGVIIGTEAGRRLRKWFPSADTLVCAFGLMVSGPFFLASLALAKYHYYWSMTTVFITQILLCLNWALVTDMTMTVVIPSRRAMANAYQMVLSHAFGDAGSPYIIGQVQVSINSTLMSSMSKLNAEYYSMQYSLMIDCIVAVIGGSLFVIASLFIVRDKENVIKVIEESRFHYETVGQSYQPEDSQIIDNTPKQSPRLSNQRII